MSAGRKSGDEWIRLADAEEIIAFVVEKFHSELKGDGHVPAAGFIALGKPKCSVRQGKVNVAKIRVISERDRALMREGGEIAHYSVEVGLDIWTLLPNAKLPGEIIEKLGLPKDADLRYPVIDHEVKHAMLPDVETDRGKLRPHDVQEFADIVSRYGIWEPGLYEFVKAAQSATLTNPQAIGAQPVKTL